MKNMFLIPAIVAMTLAGCQATVPPSAVVAPVVTKVKTIAQVAGNDFTKACSTFKVAVGYYQKYSPVIALIAPAQVELGNLAVAGGLAVCNAPSGTLSQDLASLDAFWKDVQAYTTVPK